ncbi:MAG: FtsX-like permease family protein [Erysipelotrichaceae bacterium]|nr:FtsX-like permease family protein [Erysipelotrichaceae bacterium]
MKKMQFVDAIKNIKKRFVSYISICIIVMFGIGGSFSTQYLEYGFNNTVANYYKAHNFMDYEIISSFGINENDINAIKNLQGISDVEGTISVDGKLIFNNSLQDVKVITKTERINTPDLIEGNFPNKVNEVIISKDLVDRESIKIGDKINLSATFNNEEILKNRTFTVVGSFYQPYHMRLNTTYLALVSTEAINEEITQGLYTSAYIKEDKVIDASMFDSKAFEDTCMEEKLWKLSYDLQKDDLVYYRDLAYEKIDNEWEKAQSLFEDAQKQIDENEAQLNTMLADARKQISDGKAKLDDAYKEIMAGEAQISYGEEQIKRGKEAISTWENYLNVIEPNQIINILNEAKSLCNRLNDAISSSNQELTQEIRDNINNFINREDVKNAISIAQEATSLPLNDYLQKAVDGTLLNNINELLDSAINSINDFITFKDQLPSLEKQLADGKQEIQDAWNKYNEGIKEINRQEALLNQKEAEAVSELNKAKDKLNEEKEDAIKKVELAKKEADNLDVNIIVQSRKNNFGFLDIYANCKGIGSSGKVFGVLFILITSLVCFSTIAIMVEEDKKTVGTTKAFGFFNNEILMKYLIFGISAALIGSLFGIGLACLISRFVAALLNSTHNYAVTNLEMMINIKPTILVVIFSIVICAVATILSCLSLMKTPASLLMKGETISSRDNKQKNKINIKSGTLYSRLIFKNMLDEMPRVLITIVIIAVSCTIIGTGISIKMAFDGMFERQLNDVIRYDARIEYTKDVNDEELSSLINVLEENNVDYLNVYYAPHLYCYNNSVDAFYILAADRELIHDYLNIIDIHTNQKISLPDNGVVIQKKSIEKGMNIGDDIRLLDNSLAYHDTKIINGFNNYQGRLTIMSIESYRNTFTEKPKFNCLLIKYNNTNKDAIKKAISSISSDIAIIPSDDFSIQYGPLKQLFTVILLVLVAMAIIMSFMILTNLASIYVARKQKELIVMRINGFTIKETINYLAKETIVTTTIGLIIGLIIGYFIANIALKAIEPVEIQFDRTYKPIAWIIALVLEGTFSFLINYSVFKKVKDLSFRDMNK